MLYLMPSIPAKKSLEYFAHSILFLGLEAYFIQTHRRRSLLYEGG
jgi:hypothetical protein